MSTTSRESSSPPSKRTPGGPPNTRRRRFPGIVLGGLTAVGAATAPTASALDGSSFNAGNIISDSVFYNGTALTATQVQTFLNSKVSSCAASNGQPCLKNFSQATVSRESSA